jgi:hypothetical protein
MGISCPKFRVLNSFLFKFVNVTGVFESIRIAEIKTASSSLIFVESFDFSCEKAPKEKRNKKIVNRRREDR